MTEIDVVPGWASLPGAAAAPTAILGLVLASSSATSSPVMCSVAGSHVMVSDGLLFERPVGSRTDVFTLAMVDTRLEMLSSQREPRLPVGVVIALHPRLDGRQHAERFLAADLVVAARTVVRRAGLPRRHQEVLAAEEQAGALRPADRFAAAVGDDRRAFLEVHVRDRQHLGGRIDQDRDVLRLRDPRHVLERQGSGRSGRRRT